MSLFNLPANTAGSSKEAQEIRAQCNNQMKKEECQMKKIKMFMCVAMAAALLCHTTTTVWAAVTHKSGCNNTTETYAECGSYVSTAVIREHSVFDESLDDYVNCYVQSKLYHHDLLCANSSCRVYMGTSEVRRCTEWHTCCNISRSNVCKTDY